MNATIQEVLEWVSVSILPKIDFRGFNKKGQRMLVQAKKTLFENVIRLNKQLGLPISGCAFFFRGANFEVKHLDLFGLKEQDLHEYGFASNQSSKQDLQQSSPEESLFEQERPYKEEQWASSLQGVSALVASSSQYTKIVAHDRDIKHYKKPHSPRQDVGDV